MTAAVGGLLADIGEPKARVSGADASDTGAAMLEALAAPPDKAVIDCVSFLRREPDGLSADSPAFAVRLADHIASGADRRGSPQSRGKEPFAPLVSPFATMKGEYGRYVCKPSHSPSIVYPEDLSGLKVSSGELENISDILSEKLKRADFGCVNSLLRIIERCFSYLPDNIAAGEPKDISIYDHAKLRAALASCIIGYCEENQITDLRSELYENEAAFLGKQAFLMYSCDISGIQSFIYSITSSGALKSLRGRSFALEMLMEHFIDELLEAAGLSRANLIYSGGGHCYILLPNTKAAKKAADDCGSMMRGWLIDHYGTSLYFASAYVPCSANDLMNIPAGKNPYSTIFISLSRAISSAKLHRYTADEIRRLNAQSCSENECKICGKSASGELCSDCAVFINIGKELVCGKKLVILTDTPTGGIDWELPSLMHGKVYLNFSCRPEAVGIVRFHTVNDDSEDMYGEGFTGDISVGNYCYDGDLSRLLDSARSEDGGIKRIAVCRADVDNLGAAFISGFVDKKAKSQEEANRFVTISRTAAFSRYMSLYFKRYINEILFSDGGFRLNGKGGDRKVNIVYSGGDDIFLIGVWDDVIESAVTLRDSFRRYCLGALTISAGIGVFRVKHPISDAALSTADLEDAAKSRRGRDGALIKDGIALFDTGKDFIFGWDEFCEKVVGEKLALIMEYIGGGNEPDQVQHGMSMLYKMLAFCRSADRKINIARFAYLLARLEPSSGDAARKELYKKFSEKMYAWIVSPEDRRELCMAICIYSYLTRK